MSGQQERAGEFAILYGLARAAGIPPRQLCSDARVNYFRFLTFRHVQGDKSPTSGELSRIRRALARHIGISAGTGGGR